MLIDEILRAKAGFSPLEVTLADYLLEHSQDIKKQSASLYC